MKNMNRLIFCGLIFASAASCANNPDYLQSNLSPYEAEDCKPVVEQEIDRVSIGRDKISGIDYLTHHYSGGEAGEDYKYQAWMQFDNCTGNYVVSMNRFCQIERSFTMGRCELENIVASK